MIKDKIIKMDNGKEYYILTDITYNTKKYLLSVECDLANDDVKEDEYLVMELVIENDELVIKRIEDDNLALVVTNLLLNKIKNED